MRNKSNIGRTIVSGAYGAGEVTKETDNTLTMRLLNSTTEVTVNKAGNLHYVGEPVPSRDFNTIESATDHARFESEYYQVVYQVWQVTAFCFEVRRASCLPPMKGMVVATFQNGKHVPETRLPDTSKP